jgi:hypothetical protein
MNALLRHSSGQSSMNRHDRRKAARTRKGKRIEPLPVAALRAEAGRIMSSVHLSAITETLQPLSGSQAAALGRRIAGLRSAIVAMPEGSAEQRALVDQQIIAVNELLNGARYPETVQLHVNAGLEGLPDQPPRPAIPDNNDDRVERRWLSAAERYRGQREMARALSVTGAAFLGRKRAFGLALELHAASEGQPLMMLLPAQVSVAAADGALRVHLKQMAVQRWTFDAALEGVPRSVILRRLNAAECGPRLHEKTAEDWVRITNARDIRLAEQMGVAVRDGTAGALPAELRIRLVQFTLMTFSEWVRQALAER